MTISEEEELVWRYYMSKMQNPPRAMWWVLVRRERHSGQRASSVSVPYCTKYGCVGVRND